MKTDKDLLIKGVKHFAYTFLLMFTAPIILWQAFKNQEHTFYIPVLIVGLLLAIAAIALLAAIYYFYREKRSKEQDNLLFVSPVVDGSNERDVPADNTMMMPPDDFEYKAVMSDINRKATVSALSSEGIRRNGSSLLLDEWGGDDDFDDIDDDDGYGNYMQFDASNMADHL